MDGGDAIAVQVVRLIPAGKGCWGRHTTNENKPTPLPKPLITNPEQGWTVNKGASALRQTKTIG
jgi:hypothetical protein